MVDDSDLDVAILGAGMSGLCMAIQLQKAGIRRFAIVEQSAGVGGTWWDNSYPGAHVDVPAPLYSYSFEPNPRWTRRFASAPEIQAYLQRCAERHGLLDRVRFGTRITHARFDAGSARWHIDTDRGETLVARFFVCSTGLLNQAKLPSIEGLHGFEGALMHSARWDHGVDCSGRRVGVIGTGSTASQLVAPLAERAQRLHVFQRTANWVLPRIDRVYTAFDRALARLPPYAWACRGFWWIALENGRRAFEPGAMRNAYVRLAESHLARQVSDPALRARLEPKHPFGCKRIIYSNDFYPALGRANVELVTEPIECIVPRGIVCADGRLHALDVLVCATGFEAVHPLSSLAIEGPGATMLADAWRDGAEAYHGITVAGFPNLFLLLGPNTATGHTSTLLFIEPQVRYAIACMRHVSTRGLRWIDVRADVMREHNARLQARLAGSVWAGCRSWYRSGSGKVVAIFPGFTREYAKAVARPAFGDFSFGS